MPTPIDLSGLRFLKPAAFSDGDRSRAVLVDLFAPDFDDPEELLADIDDEAWEPDPPEGGVVLVTKLPEEIDPALEGELEAMLPAQTRSRLSRFQNPRRRRQSLYGRLLAQRLANIASEVSSGSYFLREQPPEGPLLADYEGRPFGRIAIAHTEEGVAASLSRRRAGIDLEILKTHERLSGLAEFALGEDFADAIRELQKADARRADEAFLAAWGAIECAQKFNGEDRKSAAASPAHEELLSKYARPPEVEVLWNKGLIARDPAGKAVPIEFLETPAGHLTLLGFPAGRSVEFLTLAPEALLEEFRSHVRAFL